jgi:hypothetical protein
VDCLEILLIFGLFCVFGYYRSGSLIKLLNIENDFVYDCGDWVNLKIFISL